MSSKTRRKLKVRVKHINEEEQKGIGLVFLNKIIL
jgi:hypothetical protein